MRSPEFSWLRVWDRPIRIVHWSFVLLMPALWWTWKSDQMPLHKLLGHVALGLIVFRLSWGVAGSHTARFRQFVRGPLSVLRYVRGRAVEGEVPGIGHNPLGGWSVLALLTVLVAQLVSGLFTQDTDGLEPGPLSYLVSYDTADRARGWHGTLFYLLLALIALHVVAVALHMVVKRDNLVGPMLSGRKRWEKQASPPAAPIASARRAVPGIVAAGLVAWWVSRGCPF